MSTKVKSSQRTQTAPLLHILSFTHSFIHSFSLWFWFIFYASIKLAKKPQPRGGKSENCEKFTPVWIIKFHMAVALVVFFLLAKRKTWFVCV